MAYSEFLADRLRRVLQEHKVPFTEKKMMGGLALMVNNKMCVGVLGEKMTARVGKERYEEALEQPGCRPMDFTGKPMAAFVYVEDEGIDKDDDLESWVLVCLEFNEELIEEEKRKATAKLLRDAHKEARKK